MKKIDLHVHTNISDGSETPLNTVLHAKALGLAAIAVTDHDTVHGVRAAQAAGAAHGVEVVAGLELGCGYQGREVHMLGYDVDTDAPAMLSVLDWIVRDRDERNAKMVANMAKDGLVIDLDELKRRHPGSIIGRPHFALCLIEAGLADSVQDAFGRYLDPGRKYYLRRSFLSIDEAVKMIHEAGGKAVLAHPRQYRMDDERLCTLLAVCRAAGVDGMECIYSGYDAPYRDKLLALAERFGFCPTAGSDWHGSHKPHIEMGFGLNGEMSGGYELLQNLRKRSARF